MSSVPFSVAFGLLFVACFLKNSRAVPVPTTTLPPLPARRYLEPFDKDPFKDYQDYQDASKRTLAQQAIENAKKFPRPWGMPPPELFDNSFFNPNPFKEQEPRGILETNNIQPNYFEGYFPEDDFTPEEEETNFIEPAYPGDSNYLVEPPQLTYIEPPLMSSYQPNNGYSGVYMGNNDINNKDENEADVETENENFSEENDSEYDNSNLIPTVTPQPIQQTFLPNGIFPPKPQYLPKPIINSDYDSVEVENKPRQREFRSVKPSTPTKTNYPSSPPEPKTKTSKEKEIKPAVTEEAQNVEKAPAEKELFSRTTTITKTTTWYLNENDEIIMKEDVDERPSPLKGKYVRTSKTTTSGPVPWYLQEFEDIIFQEENEKSKTILDKINQFKGMTPTSITSFTTAPNPWSTEVHEEVVLEEVISKKETANGNKSGTHISPLEHIVDYLPRSQSVSDEIDMIEQILVEEIVEMFLEEDEGIIEISIIQDIPPFFPPMPPGIQYQQFPFPMIPLPPPPAQLPEKDSYEDGNFQENSYMNDMQNGINQNQVTTPKPLTTPSPIDATTFTPHPQMGPLQGPEQQMYPQPNFNYPTTQHPQMYNNQQQNPGNRRDKMEQDRRDKMNQGKQRPMYPNAQQKGMNRQGRPRDL